MVSSHVRIRTRIFVGVGVLLAVLAGTIALTRPSLLSEPDGGTAFVTVTRGNVQDAVSALGTLEPRDYVDVGAQISGQVDALHVALGDRVNEGDLLLEIDPEVFEAQVDSDRAQIRELEALLAQRRAEMTLARRQFAREKELLAQRATSRDAYESAEASVAVAESQISGLEAQLDQARSTLRANETNLGYTRIFAPISGTVVSLDARTGQTLNAKQTTPVVMRIADLSTMTVRAQVSEADVMRLEPGMTAWFTTLGDPRRRWTGTLKQVLPTPEEENDVVLYGALFDVPNPDGRLLIQMTAHVFFVRAEASDVTVLPLAALRNDRGDGEATVMVETQGGLEARTVRLGVRDRISVEVVEGLAPGDRVALPGTARAGAAAERGGPPRTPRL